MIGYCKDRFYYIEKYFVFPSMEYHNDGRPIAEQVYVH